MSRQFTLRQSLFAVLGLLTLLATPAPAQDQDFSQVEIETIPVADRVYMLMGEGGNIGLLAGEDGVLMVDDQFAPLTEKIQAAIAAITPTPLRFVINTHWHFDHTGGNENFGEAGAIIVAQDEVYTRMSTDQFIEAFQRQVPASPPAALPVITFSEETTFHLNGQTLHVFHVDPAHTDGDSVIHFVEANVIHTGDTYFNGLYPFIDTSSGGSLAGMIRAVEEILAIANAETKIIPGHGPLATRSQLEDYRDMLVAVRLTTEAAIAKGLSLEEFIATDPTAAYDDQLGQGFLTPEQFQTLVYNNLKP